MHIYFFAVFTHLMIFGLCYVSEKCFVYQGDLGDNLAKCPQSNLTGFCDNVSNVELDLAGIPSHLEVLCLNLVKGSHLHPDSLSRFYKLRRLELYGDLSDIYPGAFRNLSSLQTLMMNCFKSVTFSVSSDILGDLQNVTDIMFKDCRLSSMSVDVLQGLKRLENLLIRGQIMDFSDILCRLAFVSTLKKLHVELSDLTVLTQPHCTFPNGTSFDLKEFNRIKEVSIYFSQVTVVDKTVFKYFREFSALEMYFNEFKVLKSEIRKVDDLELYYSYQNSGGLEEICTIVTELSTTELRLTFIQKNNNFTLDLGKCLTLKNLTLYAFDQTKSLDLTFLSTLRNLTSLYVVWVMTSESIERSGVLGLCESQVITKIKMLCLHSNNLKNLTYRQFSCFNDLNDLYLSNSEIENIEDFTFNNTVLLKYLDLSKNKLSKLTEFSFFGLRHLKTLMLAENKLITVDPSAFIHLTYLDSLSLGVFQFPTSESSEIQIKLSVPENLTDLYINSGMRPMILHLDNNKKTNSSLKTLHVCGESVTFLDCENSLFESLLQLKAETEQLLCGQTFPARFLKSLTHLEIISGQKTIKMDLTDLNTLVHLKSLFLYRIDLSSQPELGVIFHNLSSLEYLNLDLCWINSLEKDLSRDLKSLKVLVLYIDGVFSITKNFVEPLNNLKYLIMHNTFLQCSCDNAWFTKWTKYQQNVQVYFSGLTLEQIQCKSTEGTKLFYKYAQENCFIDIKFLLFASTTSGLIFFMLVVLLHQLAGDYLLACLVWIGKDI